MDWAAKRKLRYFILFCLVLIVLVGIPLFFLIYEKPTCTDGKQNQNEEGIDCSGPCLKLCRAIELDPIVLWQQSFRVARGAYNAVAYIQNPNLSAEASSMSYTFKVLDAVGAVIAERKGSVYVPAGRNFAVFEPTIQLGELTPARTVFEFDPEFTWTRATNDLHLVVENPELMNASTSPIVRADIENPSLENVYNVEVTALMYDIEGNAFAASRTIIDKIDRQSRAQAFFTWPEAFTKNASRIEIIPIIK